DDLVTGVQTCALPILIDLAGLNACLEARIAFNLGYAKGRESSIQEVVVVAIVLECLPEWGRAVEAGDAVGRECFEVVNPGDAEQIGRASWRGGRRGWG